MVAAGTPHSEVSSWGHHLEVLHDLLVHVTLLQAEIQRAGKKQSGKRSSAVGTASAIRMYLHRQKNTEREQTVIPLHTTLHFLLLTAASLPAPFTMHPWLPPVA